ncbi:aldo/keto reductase [Serratia microhaemolytica]|uniref:aldo/keto reductase n=1 Tax=Serratia microhaemolytica TaxID=2675110 RepID=UPI000FDE2B57|nr:aldo/keto reductase [Serratia microhaemolytica]
MKHSHFSTRQIAGRVISPIGLGCMGMSEFYGSTDDIKSLDILETAIELGVEHFDTADMYGNGHNETLLGRFLSVPGRRNKILLASKCGIVRDSHDHSARLIDNSPEYIISACERSVQRLGTHIDLYYLHRIANNGKHIEQSMEGMAHLLSERKIGAVGLSEANSDVIRRADAALRRLTNGKHGISAVQSEYSLLTRTVEGNGVLTTCEQLGAAFVAYSPISRGLLSEHFDNVENLAIDDFRRGLPRFSAVAFEHNRKIICEISFIAKRYGASIAQVALSWLLHRSPIVHPIPGTKQLSYLQQNIAAKQLQLTAIELLQLDNLLVCHHIQGERYPPSALASFSMDH